MTDILDQARTIADPTKEREAIAAGLHEIAKSLATDDPERFHSWAFEHCREWAALDDPLHEEGGAGRAVLLHVRRQRAGAPAESARGRRRRHRRLAVQQSFVTGFRDE
jgi:hypothetical protein